MNPARIAELLAPFLRAPLAIPDGSCDSEPAPTNLTELCHSEPTPSGLAAPCHPEPAPTNLSEVYHSGPVPTNLTEVCHSEPAKAGEEPAVLSPAQLQSISTYIDILLRWNARINLTAIRDPEQIVTRHFGESLFAARHLYPASIVDPTHVRSSHINPSHVGPSHSGPSGRAALQGRVTGQKEIGALAPESIADVGSGAGFPGLPIKLWAPQLALTLIESNHKKSAFLREVARALTLTDINIQTSRAETLTATFAVVTLRAVERFDAILSTAASLVAPGGRLVLLISATQEAQARSTLPHLEWSTPLPVPQSHSRVLLVARSVIAH
jgi:16S rRNA (guanine527-N7)-methyltransferase